MISDTARILIPAALTFIIGMGLTPFVTHYLYAMRAWKKRAGKVALNGEVATEFNKLHELSEVRAPRMGGIVIWGSVTIATLSLALFAAFSSSAISEGLNFLSRNQTWLPLATLLVGAFAGLVDDLMVIRPSGDGLPLSTRLAIVITLSLLIGYWFYEKLEVTAINIPFAAPWEVGIFIIPCFVFVSLALYASGVIDGIDGLSGGVFMNIFVAYTVIAFAQNQIDLAGFTAAIVGGILAFLWFNIPPARFYMSDTGTMALTLSLAVVAFMTDDLGSGYGVAVLPVVGALLVVTVASNVLQVSAKKFLGRKILRVAPLHHHFEALGWPGYKVAMRYWILSTVFAFIGVILAVSAL